MRAHLGENELRQMNISSFVMVFCFLLLCNQVR
jgi:hypothetical protein